MIRNRNGYWMSPEFYAMFAPDSGSGVGGAGVAGDGTPGGNAGGTSGTDGGNGGAQGSDGAGNGTDGNGSGGNSPDDLNAEIARLKVEIANQKKALDKATHEASENKKAMNKAQADLKAKMTQEEIDAQAKQEAAQQAAQELEDLRREVAKGKTVKTVMGKLGLDEEAAGNLADHLFGAADIENALLEIQKAWQAKEAALKKEFGRITGPGAGGDSNSPQAKAIKMAQDLGKARSAVSEQAKKALEAYMR